MNEIIIHEITEKNIWEEFLQLHPESNFLQSWDWGEFHIKLNHPVIRSGFYRDNQLVGIVLSVVEPARRGRYLTIPAGPILDWHDELLVNAFFTHIRDVAKKHRCAFVRIRPQLVEDDFSKKIFADHSAISAPMHLHAELTNQLDISLAEEELLKNMRKATRYEIKKGLGLPVQILSSTNPDDIKEFYDLQLVTAQRQKFVPFSYTFLYEQFKVFADAGNAVLYSAKYEDKLLAQAFIIFYGKEAVYHYGASTDEGRKYPGAYVIQWEAIKEAKKRGMTRYNFWGVAPLEETHHRFAGLSIFKRGFGGQDVAYLHAQDIVIDRKRYLFTKLVESVRKKVRRV